MIERLTKAEELFIAERLFSRARAKSKNLSRAVERGWHPNLIDQLREDISECTRLATILQEAEQ